MTEEQKQPTVEHQNAQEAPPRASFATRMADSRLSPAEIREKVTKARSGRLLRLKETLTERSYKWVANTPAKFLDRRLKTLLGEASPKVAIRAKCEECVGYEDVLPRVGDCRSRSCELWAYRPYQDQMGKHPYHHD